MDVRLRALNGFGLGARMGEAERMRDPRGWLRAQLEGGAPIVAPPANASPARIADTLRAFRTVGQVGGPEQQQARQQARRGLIELAAVETRAALTERLTTARPFVERLVAFWSNHVCVSMGAKLIVAPLAGSYERDAIRPHVLGRFEELVLASAKHPAMLLYLDNFQSIGPASRGARLAARGRGGRGLNENYARELLELHTLGVDGGYAQQDVQELARVLTGWTIHGFAPRGRGRLQNPATGSIGFAFQESLHEPGSKTILGVEYREAGVAEGERAIRALCREPATARFVATKLVRHFVGDDPPPAAVERLSRVFRSSDGDLRAVSAALIDLPDAWSPGARKFRTPQDWLVAALRAFDSRELPEQALTVLRQLRHPLWSPPAPKGFGDTTQEWADPDSLLNRAELSRTIARRVRGIDPRALLDVVDAPADDPLRRVLVDPSIPADERIALALAGPAFQWR